MKVIGGSWLKERNNYDQDMCQANSWLCIQERHFDALIDGKKVEVKKTKTSSVIIKLQQLAEILLTEKLQDIHYLIVRTDASQEDILETLFVPSLTLCELQGMTPQLASEVLSVHNTFNCTLQKTMKLKDIKIHPSCICT